MTYSEYIQNVTLWLSGTTISGSTKNLYIKHCLTDEIELEVDPVGSNYDFHIYITPLPITIDGDNRSTYGCQVYIVGDVGLSPMVGSGVVSDRFTTFDRCITFFQAFIQQIPSDGVPDFVYPMTGNLVLLWDSKVDGVYFDITMITGVECI